MTPGKGRQLALLGGVLLIAMLGISLASFAVSRASMREQLVDATLPLVGDTIYSEIQRDVLRPAFVSSMMASNTFVHDWAAGGEEDVARMTRYLASVRDDYGAFTAFFVSEATRTYYHADGPLKTVREAEPRDAWYFRLRDMDAPFEINTDVDMANGDELTVFVNYRVRDARGRYLGAIGVGMSSRSITRLLVDYGRTFGRRVYFVDPDGAFQLGFSPHAGAATIHDVDGLSALAPSILATRRESAHAYRGADGRAFLNSRWIAELGWTLMVEQIEGATLGPIRRALLASLAVTLTLGLAALGIAARLLAGFQRELERSATRDPLTGALNRQSFDEAVRRAFAHDGRRTDRLSMVFVDIDHFKRINDRLGHAAGDAAIRHAVDVMRGALRDSDAVCRWGGEEFCALLGDADLEEARRAGEHVRRAIAAEPFGHEGARVPMTVSVGVAERAPRRGRGRVLRTHRRRALRGQAHRARPGVRGPCPAGGARLPSRLSRPGPGDPDPARGRDPHRSQPLTAPAVSPLTM